MIKVYNDCKGKHQSFEASFGFCKNGPINGHSSVDVFGYGETEIEAVHNLRMNARDLVIDLFLALEGETQRVNGYGNLLTKEEIELEKWNVENRKFMKELGI